MGYRGGALGVQGVGHYSFLHSFSDRHKVLTHHPDKQSEEEQQKDGDNLFKCIKIGESRASVTDIT
jgi:hypothetical protein